MAYLVINRQQTSCSDDTGRRTRRKCDGAGAGCRLCVAFGTGGYSGRARCGNHRARGQGSSLREGLVNTGSTRKMFVSFGADGAPTYRLETLDDWIARTKARGHALLEEKQLKFHIERCGNIADIWSSYTAHIDGKPVARGINSIQAIKETGG
jgi:hypothetical protein